VNSQLHALPSSIQWIGGWAVDPRASLVAVEQEKKCLPTSYPAPSSVIIFSSLFWLKSQDGGTCLNKKSPSEVPTMHSIALKQIYATWDDGWILILIPSLLVYNYIYLNFLF
jgi:hypothetical protein